MAGFMGAKTLVPTSLSLPKDLDITDKESVAINLRAALAAYNSAAFIADQCGLNFELVIRGELLEGVAILRGRHELNIDDITSSTVVHY